MKDVIDFKEQQNQRDIKKLDDMIGDDQQLRGRTMEYLKNSKGKVENKIQSIRIPVELLEWIDSYTAIQAIIGKKRINRNQVIVGFLETMKAVIEYQETQSGFSHTEAIKALVEKARLQQGENNDQR